jgi:hypothetical protein
LSPGLQYGRPGRWDARKVVYALLNDRETGDFSKKTRTLLLDPPELVDFLKSRRVNSHSWNPTLFGSQLRDDHVREVFREETGS